MSNNWKTYILGEISDIFDSLHQTPKYSEQGISMVRVTDIKEGYLNIEKTFKVSEEIYEVFSKKHKPNFGDIVMSRVGSYGISSFVNFNSKFCIGQNTLIISPKIESKFLYYSLISNSVKEQIEACVTGSTQKTISLKDIKLLSIKCPSRSEQKAIASILSALDDKIELNLQMNKTLEEMAMALYKHWFVDFGPFKDGKFVESELGMIPEGWEVKKLEDIITIKHGYAFKGEYFDNEEKRELLLTPGNFKSEGGIKFSWGKQEYYSGQIPKDYILQKGDLILALTDLTQSCEILGSPALIPDEDHLYLHNQRIGLVNLLDINYSNEFLYCIANTYEYREYLRNTKTGSTVSHTSPTRIYEYKLALPIKPSFIELNKTLKDIFKKTHDNLSENKTLTQLRDTLLPKLISGEVRVKDLEKMDLSQKTQN